ncbi:hypothetical protein TELCIR_17676, partial [Teladorsagia circumcincta]
FKRYQFDLYSNVARDFCYFKEEHDKLLELMPLGIDAILQKRSPSRSIKTKMVEDREHWGRCLVVEASNDIDFIGSVASVSDSALSLSAQTNIDEAMSYKVGVLCSLVDEIGSLRTENRRLKIRLAPPPPRSKNVVQRVSAIFDSHTSIFPRLRRAAHAEIRTGARERLSTPPRK